MFNIVRMKSEIPSDWTGRLEPARQRRYVSRKAHIVVGLLAFVLSGSLAGCSARLRVTAPTGNAYDNWSAVTSLSRGNVLRLEVLGIGSITARYVSALNDQVTVLDGSSERTFLRREVRAIALIRHHAAQRAKRGLAIGAAAGGLWVGSARRLAVSTGPLSSLRDGVLLVRQSAPLMGSPIGRKVSCTSSAMCRNWPERLANRARWSRRRRRTW